MPATSSDITASCSDVARTADSPQQPDTEELLAALDAIEESD